MKTKVKMKMKPVVGYAVIIQEKLNEKPYTGFAYEEIERVFVDSSFSTAVVVEQSYEQEIRQYLRERKSHGLNKRFKIIKVLITQITKKK